MGLPGHLVFASPGTEVFLKKITLKKTAPDRRTKKSLCGVATFIVFSGMGAFCPHLCNPLNTCVTHTKNSKELFLSKGQLTQFIMHIFLKTSITKFLLSDSSFLSD
jgi:hypothetical protein